MRKFMDENFLLKNKTAEKLYHDYAKDMTIFDYHCHLSSKEIAENKSFKNITEIWLRGDHYKWRAMRSNGISEEYITGDASDYEKFKAWAKTVPYCIGNPLYHWSHLELKRYFDIDIIINENTADEIWEKTNALLNRKNFTAKGIIKKFNVKVICTTDDAIDSLEYHKKIKEDKDFYTTVVPTLRPDKGINIQNDGFVQWVNKLSEVSNIDIKSYDDLIKALYNRINFFHEEGCRSSDHGLDKMFFRKGTDEEINEIFQKAMNGQKLNDLEIDKYKTMTMVRLAEKFNELDWTMQFHIGALRNNNTKMFEKLGPDTGFDSIGDENIAASLSKLLDTISIQSGLPKTILYSLNAKDNDVLAAMIGNFQDGRIPGKIQFGTAWWFNDQKDGMEKQMISLANLGLLSRFVGMVTDSRSFLSYTRHEYFRRVLCNLVGTWVEEGEVPYDMELLGNMVQDICYNNAFNYFGIE
ncbi:glucuronate isomerase [Schnuerera sp. xch1]|uniref:glucuronate isomerase n=1 Tax=Schnuerera sp. xch1 TaxID=2874283 RepID=UPI001CBED503|nr:glucuronate isomerase [Schnuerera sp. xch1]MBZ2174054.1 glucuronate isomerase [Schnuerera sp. xch1]